MKQSDKLATVPMQVRLPKALREQLEKETEREGTTLNREIVQRIEASFKLQDAFGEGHFDMLDFYMMMGNGFAAAGKRAAEQAGHPEWSGQEWRCDPECFEKASLAVAEALWTLHPDLSGRLGMFRFWLSRLYGRVAAIYKEKTGEISELPAIGPSTIDLRDQVIDPLEDTSGWIGGIVR
jgi:hypothetical protein